MPASYTSGQSPILAGIQPAELRRSGVTLSLARRGMEPGHLLSTAIHSVAEDRTHKLPFEGRT